MFPYHRCYSTVQKYCSFLILPRIENQVRVCLFAFIEQAFETILEETKLDTDVLKETFDLSLIELALFRA